MNKVFSVVVIALLLLVLIIANVVSTSAVLQLREGLVWMPGNATINLGNCTWDSLPLVLREDLSRRFESTKLNRDDLERLHKYYWKMYVEYTEPVSLNLEER